MIIVVYVLTIIAFYVAAMVVPNLFLVLLVICRRAMNLPAPTNRFPVLPHLVSAILLMMLTRVVWGKLGYEPGWLLIGILALLHFLNPGNTEAGKTNAYGTMFGLIIYGFIR